MSEKTVKELREEAKALGVKGRWDMAKGELEKAIAEAKAAKAPAEAPKEEVVETEAKAKVETKRTREDRMNVGEIVAYRRKDGSVKSAMIKKKSTPRRALLVETQYGKSESISFDDVVWVKTKRWPAHVLKKLKKNDKGGMRNVEREKGEC